MTCPTGQDCSRMYRPDVNLKQQSAIGSRTLQSHLESSSSPHLCSSIRIRPPESLLSTLEITPIACNSEILTESVLGLIPGIKSTMSPCSSRVLFGRASYDATVRMRSGMDCTRRERAKISACTVRREKHAYRGKTTCLVPLKRRFAQIKPVQRKLSEFLS